MTRTFMTLASAVILGCGGGANSDETSTGSSTGASPMTDGASETGVGTTPDPTTGAPPTSSTSSTDATSGPTTSGFVGMPDIGDDNPAECDIFAQDCPDGMKCAAYAMGGGTSWNATKCVPITGDPQPGEPCTADGGGVSGLDDCIKGAMCWDVDEEDHGTCIALCSGPAEQPSCPAGGVCSISDDSVLNVCFPTCDPLLQDCAGDELCLAAYDSYLCIPDASGDTGAVFDPCEFFNVCDKGLLCLQSSAASECAQDEPGCCVPMCSIAGGDAACPGAGQKCLPVYEPQPAGFEDIGVCAVMF